MARTVAGTRQPEPAGPYRGQGACEFCRTRTQDGVRHDLCPGEIHTTSPGRKDNNTWQCQCAKEDHQT